MLVPATPQVFLSEQAQEHRNRPTNESVIADFDEYYEISYNSLSFCLKIMFLGSFKSSQVGLSYPTPILYITCTCNPCRLP